MELLIRIVDKSPDPLASKMGDVIWVCANGWAWSTAEMNNPEWIIVRTGITQVEADGLLAADIGVGDIMARRRKYAVDVAAGGLTKPEPPRIIDVPVSQFRKIYGLKP